MCFFSTLRSSLNKSVSLLSLVLLASIGWLVQSTAATSIITSNSNPNSLVTQAQVLPSPQTCNSCTSEGPQVIYAPLVALAQSAETEINLNCRSAHTLVVTPTFFTMQGEAFAGEPFEMLSTETKTVKLKSLMPAAVRNRHDLGGMTLSYTGGMFEMWGQLRLMRINHGNSIDVTFALSQDPRSSTRNAVWWMPANGEAVIALGNFGSSVVKGKATFSNGRSEQVEVPAFGTQLIYYESQSESAGKGESITIEASESGSSLIATGAVTSHDAGYTSSIRFYDPRFVAQPNLYATNFRLADVTPRLVLRNTGTTSVVATPRFIPVFGDAKTFIDLPAVSLNPGEIVNVDLDALKNATVGKTEFDHVSIQVLNSGTPGSLIGVLNGIDSRNKMTYDVPLRDIGECETLQARIRGEWIRISLL